MKTTCRVGLARDLQRVERRIDHADVGPGAARGEHRAPPATRNTHHVAIGRQNHPVPLGQFERIVEPPHRQHADRAPRPMDEADIAGHQILHAIAEDRVGMPAAELHEGISPVGPGLARDGAGKALREGRIAEFETYFMP
jgi:hypothetical protein